MNKRIVTRDELIAPKLKGLAQVAGIVKRTLGPGGLPILIERFGQSLDGSPLGPKITKDGVSVAEECGSSIKEEDVIIQAVKAICKKTVTVAGDGTTTAIVLGEAIVNEMEKVLKEDTTLNPQLVKEELEAATKEVVAKLKEASISVGNNWDMVRQVATISANGDDSIGKIIQEAFQQVGAEGVITVDEGYTNEVTLDKVEGYQFNRGAEGRNAFYNSKDGTQFEAEKCAVIIYDGKLYNYMDIVPALKLLAGVGQDGRATKKLPPILIMANEFSAEVLQFLLIQKTDMGMQVCPVLGPNTTHIRSAFYDDLAVYTGGTRLGNGTRNVAAIEEDDIGLVSKVVVDKYKTTLYDGQGHEDEVMSRVDQLKVAKTKAESPYDVQIINDRIASLTSGIAKIGVGGVTELEIKEKYDRIEDALNAARAAIQEGVVAGGGTALLRISEDLDGSKGVGYKILKKALRAPFECIMDNIGFGLTMPKHIFVEKIGMSHEELSLHLTADGKRVFDARDRKVKDALEAGIIDPVKVTRTALENAVSIAALLSTAGGAIVFVKDDPK